MKIGMTKFIPMATLTQVCRHKPRLSGNRLQKQDGFFQDVDYARTPSEYIAYDVTSVSSYSRGIEALEWGYNRDKERPSSVELCHVLRSAKHAPPILLCISWKCA